MDKHPYAGWHENNLDIFRLCEGYTKLAYLGTDFPRCLSPLYTMAGKPITF